MNLYRRLLEWLAQPVLRAERLELQWERLKCAAGVRLACDTAYLKGHHDGEQGALDKMAWIIFNRGGDANLMTAEDLANTRKGLTH